MTISTIDRDNLIMRWQNAAKQMQLAVEAERLLRQQVAETLFPTAVVGTNNIDLGMGYKLKMVRKINYNLDTEKTETALDRIEKMGNEGSFIAERLVSWKPTLSLTEYKKLPTEMKTVIDDAITTSDGMPTLEVVEPKNKG